MNTNKKRFLNTYISDLTMETALRYTERLLQSGQKAYVVAVNTDVIVKIENDKHLKKIIDEADIVLTDGKPLIWISKYLRNPIKEKISGSDFVPLLLKLAANKCYSIFILGGKEGVALKAQKQIEASLPNINIVGTYSPTFGFDSNQVEIEKINETISNNHPDILIVCCGCPKQEKFIYDNYRLYDAKLSVCAGATVDFLAGNMKRAPVWISNVGLEWFFRFLMEPKRLFKRYFVEDVKILKIIKKYK